MHLPSPLAAILSLAAVATLAACRDRPTTGPTTAAAPALPAPTAATPAAAGAGGAELRSLAGRLAFEAANRPSGTPRLEALVTAAATAGVEIVDTRQYLGLTAAAAYCAGGRTADGLAVAVCEYPDPAAAAAGRAHVERRFPDVGLSRRIVIRGATTLTTTAHDPGLTGTQAAVERVFATL